MPFKSTAALTGLLALAAAPAFAQGPATDSFPTSLDESGLRAWLAAQTDMPASAVVSIGSNSVIGLKQVIGDPAGPGRYQIQIRAEVVNQRTASQGGYLSWAADLAVDCVQRRTRALGITNYTQRNLKGEPRVVGGPAADWVTPAAGTQLYSLLSSVCDLTFKRPLDMQTAAASPAPPPARPAAVAAQTAPPPVAPRPAPPQAAPVVAATAPKPPAPRPAAPAPTVVAQAPAPVAPRPTAPPPPPMVIAVAPPAPPASTASRPVDADDEPAATAPAAFPPAAPPPRAEPPKVQVAVAAPPSQVIEPSPANAAPTFAPPPPQPPAPPPPRRPLSKAAIQVGAGGSESEARNLAAKAKRNAPNGSALSVTVSKANVNGRTVYRALLSGFTGKGEAASACQAIKSRGQDCFVRDSY